MIVKRTIRKAKIADVDACYKLTKTPEFIFPGGRGFVKKYLPRNTSLGGSWRIKTTYFILRPACG